MPLTSRLSGRLSEFLFLGTGTSSNVPNIYCLTKDPPTCKVCINALNPPKTAAGTIDMNIGSSPYLYPPSISKDRRRTTSALARFQHSDGRTRNILIDCGKNFYESALSWFTKYRLRRIDAVFLTHGHADAIFGLDDLRAWTIGGSNYSVQDSIDIYLDQETFEVVERAFPYIVDTNQATGGGEVPAVQFHIIGSKDKGYKNVIIDDELVVEPIRVNHGVYPDGSDFPCLGFKFGDDVTYISDASEIPSIAMNQIKGSKLFVLDGLHDKPHRSHFSIDQSVEQVLKVLPPGGVGYLTGFTHRVFHDDLEKELKERKDINDAGVKIFPAYDGLLVNVNSIKTE